MQQLKQKPISLPTTSALHSLQLDSSTLLLWASLGKETLDGVTIYLDDVPCEPEQLVINTSQAPYLCAAVQKPKPGDVIPVIDFRKFGKVIACQGDEPATNGFEDFRLLYDGLTEEDKEYLFVTLTGSIAQRYHLSGSQVFRSTCLRFQQDLKSPVFDVKRSFWLAPGILYFEGEAAIRRPVGEPDLLFISSEVFDSVASRFLQLNENDYGFIAVFRDARIFYSNNPGSYTYFCDGRPVPIAGLTPQPAYGMEFIEFINSKPPYQKEVLCKLISQALLDSCADWQQASAAEIIRKLQLYLTLPIIHCMEAGDPFNLHFETVIPVGLEGVFVGGWMRDPYHMLESIQAHSALGFSFPINGEIFRTKRPDVQQHYLGTQYGGFDQDMGFAAYGELPRDIADRLRGKAELHALHFTARLKGGVTHEIYPQILHRDAHASRDVVLKMIPSAEVSEDMLTRCLGPVIRVLQDECVRNAKVGEVHEIGALPPKPVVSLSIPLYQQLNFLKVQFATLANDPAIRDCEINYVLDSPWQKTEVLQLLQELSHLYQLPVRLIVMQRNSGYAVASNTGTHFAKGEYIILLNSDVFPRSPGWTKRMVDFYASQENIGALAPKLLYEDDSLQHAGMFFAKTTFKDWLNLHYYKGFARDYAPASISRPVPAVTGACLMMSRSLWNEIGMLATDYVIGDFEDSDLCMKCTAKGKKNWYFADAELYHLERQSVPFNNSYADSLAWRYNARQHTDRWNDLIGRLMAEYEMAA